MKEFDNSRARKSVHKKEPQKQGLPRWPTRLLAFLVLGFCLFVGVTSSHLFIDNFALLDPLDPATYGLVRTSIDEGYQNNLFDERQTGGGTPAGDGGLQADGGEGDKPVEQNTEQGAKNPLKDALVDLNGLANEALGVRELNGVVKLDNGYITATLNEPLDLSAQVSKTVEFYNYVREQGKPFVFVMAPHLIDKYDPKLPAGVTDYFNQMADEFLQAIGEAGVPAIDLREVMHDEGFDHYGGFFRTDHHWTPATAAWATDWLMRELVARGWLADGEINVTPDSFEAVHDSVQFYGTAAERTGPGFAGSPDTLDCLVPKEDVRLQYINFGQGQDEYGEDSHSFETLYRGWENADSEGTMDALAYYLYKTMYERTVRNEAAPIDSHLMLVCDSFGVPLQSFATAYVEKLTAFYGREHMDLAGPVQESDVVMVLYNPSTLDIRTENQTLFNFR